MEQDEQQGGVSIDDLLDPQRPKPGATTTAPDTAARSIDDLLGAESPRPTTTAPAATPAPRRGVASYLSGKVGTFEPPPVRPEDTRRLIPPVDRRTPAEIQQDNTQIGRQMLAQAVRPDATATPDYQAAATGFGTVAKLSDVEQTNDQRAAAIRAGEAKRFSPQAWAEISTRGIEYANRLHEQGRHQEAEDVLRKAYNAQLISQGAATADVGGAIVLSNMLGIIHDPFATQRRNLAEAAQPGMLASPEEQRRDLDIDPTKAVGPQRPFDLNKDLALPLVGQAAPIIVGGAAGRGVAAILGGAAERAGLQGVGRAIGRLAEPFEEIPTFGPAAPVRSWALLGTRIAEEAAELQRNLPQILGRGATEGQVVMGVQTYRMAREQGADPEQALAAASESVGIGIPFGAALGLATAIGGRVAGIGFDPVGHAARGLRDLVAGRETEQGRTSTVRPLDEVSAASRMDRATADVAAADERAAAAEAEIASDPNVQAETEAQAEPGKRQGPLTLEQTLAVAKRAADAGDETAGAYVEALNKYVDAWAALNDAGPESANKARLQIAIARAKQGLNKARENYGAQFGASAVLALAANDDDLTDEEKQAIGLGGVAILSTAIVPHGEGNNLPARQINPATESRGFVSRLATAVEKLPGKRWDSPVPAVDWIGKLKGGGDFTKAELATILPALESLQQQKTKVSRADVLELVRQQTPEIKRVTLADKLVSKDAARRTGDDLFARMEADPEDLADPDEVHEAVMRLVDGAQPRHAEARDFVRQQIANREEAIAQIEGRIEEEQADAQRIMDDADETRGRRLDDLRESIREAGGDPRAIDDAIDLIHERVEGDYIPQDTIDRAMQKIEYADLYESKSPEELFEEHGWTVREREVRPYNVDIEVGRTRHHGTGTFEEGETVEELQRHFAEEYGVDPSEVRITEFDPETEWVAYDYSGNEVGSDTGDREDFLRDMVERNGLEDDNILEDVRYGLERYAEAYSDWSRVENDYYWRTEGEAYEEEQSEIEDHRAAIEQLRGTMDDLQARALNAPTPAAQLEPFLEPEGQGEGRPEGEPIAVVPPPDEPLQRIEPPVDRKSKFASYQRIGGGRDYAEMLNVWSNDPASRKFTGGHWSEYTNTVSHIRAETHDAFFDDLDRGDPLPSDEFEQDATMRALKRDYTEGRANAAEIRTRMADIIRRYDALADKEGYAAQQLAQQYAGENADLTRQQKRVDSSADEIRRIRGTFGDAKPVRVMLETQSDLAQTASREGVADPARMDLLRDRIAEGDRRFTELNRQLSAGVDEVNRQYQEQVSDIADQATRNDVYRRIYGEWRDQERRIHDQMAIVERDQNVAAQQLRDVERGVPPSAFTDTKTALTLNAARFLLDAAERNTAHIAWSDAANRMQNSGLPLQAAHLTYDEITPSAMKRLLGGLGFKDVTIDKITIKGFGHWHIELTEPMRRAIRKAGLPILGVLAATSLPDNAEAQTPDGKRRDTSDRSDLYATAIGGTVAGAALMFMAQGRKVRRIVKMNADLERALMVDDLSGLANKKAFLRARDGVDHDPNYSWVVFDGDRFKKLNDTHGHAEGDKAIQHFGKTVMDAAERLGIPMRGFRFGGDEIAFAAPKGQATAFLKMVEDKSVYTKGDVATKLSGAIGDTFNEADAVLGETKAARKAADPTLRREGDSDASPAAGVTLYSSPVGPALRQIAKYPSAAAVAALGGLALDSDNEYVRKAGPALITLGALNAIGSQRLIAGKDKLVSALFDRLNQSAEGRTIGGFFNPDRLLDPQVLEIIKEREIDAAEGPARGARITRQLSALSPAQDRRVSDVIEGEDWEDATQFSPEETRQILAAAAAAEAEIKTASAKLVSSGARDPDQLLENYAGRRRYAYYDAQDAQAEIGSQVARRSSRSTRISALDRRTLDEPIRQAQQALADAQAGGDPVAIQAAQDAVDAAQVEQMSRRLELGEIRESSQRVGEAVSQAYIDAANAKALTALRQHPSVVHPEWNQAYDDLVQAKADKKAAATQADRDAAQQAIDAATVRIADIRRKAARKGSGYTVLPESKSLGSLAGAVVTDPVAHEIVGFTNRSTYQKLLSKWKEIKTQFNPGTHQGNIIGNLAFAHMKGLPIWEQLLPSPSSKVPYLLRAARDMRDGGPASKALANAGQIGAGNATLQGASGLQDLGSLEGLEDLLATTRPETADVLRAEGVTEQARDARNRRALVKRTVAGTALGAAKLYDPDEPEDTAIGAVSGALIGALLGSKARKKITKIYGSEDDLFRVATWLKRTDGGMRPEDATKSLVHSFGMGRSRSPFVQVLASTTSPFIRWSVNALPEFAADVVDHPWRYLTLMGGLAALNEWGAASQGERTQESDIPIGQRRRLGYALPGITQLPGMPPGSNVDVSRWTPLSSITTNAPPGSVPAAFSERLPDLARVGGPAIDLAVKFGGNLNPMSGKQEFPRDNPPGRNLATLLNETSGVMLPSMLDYYAPLALEDVHNRDFDKLRTDAMGPLGLRPRVTQPGRNVLSATYTLQNSLSQFSQELTRNLLANKNPNRVAVINGRYLDQVRQAIANFRDRTGQEPPPEAVQEALDAAQRVPAAAGAARQVPEPIHR